MKVTDRPRVTGFGLSETGTIFPAMIGSWVVLARLAVSFTGSLMAMDAELALPVYDPEPDPVHERNM